MINLDLENYCEYCYVQSRPSVAVLQVVPARRASEAGIRGLPRQIQKRVHGVLELDVEIIGSLPAGPRGKRWLVDQQIAGGGASRMLHQSTNIVRYDPRAATKYITW